MGTAASMLSPISELRDAMKTPGLQNKLGMGEFDFTTFIQNPLGQTESERNLKCVQEGIFQKYWLCLADDIDKIK